MKVFLAGVHSEDADICGDKTEIFKCENDAIEWIREELELLGKNHIKEGFVYIRKSHNSNFWQIINKTDDENIPLAIGYGFMYIKQLR